MQDRHRQFLIELDADKTRHSGRTLFDHLKGVHDLLRDWDNDEGVCLAGLYHSIYGTKAFKHQSLDDRAKLVEMIGEHAELLVYTFSRADRPFFKSVASEPIRTQLLEIEAANLLEQGNTKGKLKKLAKLRRLSDGAKAALGGVV